MALSILGSTGSIGRQALEVAADLGIPVCALAAGRNGKLLEAQARNFRPKYAVLEDEAAAKLFKLNFWRAPTDNDRGWNMPSRCKAWKQATETQTPPEGCTAKLDVRKLGEGKYLVEMSLLSSQPQKS